MRYRMSFLLGVLSLGILAMAGSAPAYYEPNSFNLERTVIRGYVECVQNQVAYIQTYDGEEVAVQLGPESYWNARHYYLPEGEYVEMDVWYDPTDRYTDWYFAGEIWGPNFHFALANDEGVPYWVIYPDDYYYSLGYRASCVSYMYWYDCPPVYFVFLVLPPPPPRTYACYYGPHWWTHHSDWNYGPRYGHDGSYWHDGRGHERPGRRSHDVTVNDPRGENANAPSLNTVNQYQRTSQPVNWNAKSQPVSSRRMMPPQEKFQTQRPAPVPPAVRNMPVRRVMVPEQTARTQRPAYIPPKVSKVPVQRSAPPERQVQARSNNQWKADAGRSTAVRQAPRATSRPQVNQPSRRQDEKRAVADNQGRDRKEAKR